MMKSFFLAGAVTLAALPVWAADIMVKDAYARASSPTAKSGAAFMVLHNMGATPDRLVAARSDVAARVELHTHMETGDGVMKMMEVEQGFEIPAGGTHALARGGDHVMFMGLNTAFEQDTVVQVTLVFEKAGDIVIDIPVDLNRAASGNHDHGHGHSQGHGHGDMKMSN